MSMPSNEQGRTVQGLHDEGSAVLAADGYAYEYRLGETLAGIDEANSTSTAMAQATKGDVPIAETAGKAGSSESTQITPCDQKFASIFGGDGAVARTSYDYDGLFRGLNPAARAQAATKPRIEAGSPVWDSEHLYNFPHLSGNLAGTEDATIFVPRGYVSGSVTGPSKGAGVITFFYKEFFGEKNVTLAIFHVKDFNLQREGDRVRVGTTGDPVELQVVQDRIGTPTSSFGEAIRGCCHPATGVMLLGFH